MRLSIYFLGKLVNLSVLVSSYIKEDKNRPRSPGFSE